MHSENIVFRHSEQELWMLLNEQCKGIILEHALFLFPLLYIPALLNENKSKQTNKKFHTRQ